MRGRERKRFCSCVNIKCFNCFFRVCVSACLVQYSCGVLEREREIGRLRREWHREREKYSRNRLCNITGIVYVRTCLYPVDFRVYVSLVSRNSTAPYLYKYRLRPREKNKKRKRTCFFSFLSQVSAPSFRRCRVFCFAFASRPDGRSHRRSRNEEEDHEERNPQKWRDGRRARVARYGRTQRRVDHGVTPAGSNIFGLLLLVGWLN